VTTKNQKPHQDLISTTAELLEVEPQPIVRGAPGPNPTGVAEGPFACRRAGFRPCEAVCRGAASPIASQRAFSRRSIAFRLDRVGPLSPAGAKSAPMRRTRKRPLAPTGPVFVEHSVADTRSVRLSILPARAVAISRNRRQRISGLELLDVI
jgi:hypothetical protein